MRLSFSALFFGYLIAEALLLLWFWSAFGTVALVSLLVAGFLLGLLVMRIAGLTAFRALTNAQARAAAFGVVGADGTQQVVHGPAPSSADLQTTAEDLGRSSLLFVAGILLLVPGILSGIVGLALLLPPVRARLARRLSASMRTATASATTITVVEGDSGGWTAQQWTSRPPSGDASGGTVIKGEILPPPPHNDH